MIPLDWVRSQIAMAGERVGGMVLHSHSCDTPSMLPDLVTGAPVLGWGGELELVMAEQASAYFSWSQIDDEGQFGLTAAREPFNRPLATDRLTMTNYEPWWCLVGSRLSETTAYVLPHSGEKFANVLRQVFDTETGRPQLIHYLDSYKFGG